jgi:SAM-dependent methyltransferase
MTELSQGYVTDVPYTRGFFRELAPAWLDFTATLSGVAAPDRRDGFDWCEIGCGQGVTTAILAATHPRGRFVGIDLLPEHIGHAGRLAAAAEVANARFIAADIAADNLDLPAFDYIVSHGVYSWVDSKTQAALRRLIDRRLRPGGLVYLSYNTMPGWFADAPFQYLVRALASGLAGDSATRFAAAAKLVRKLVLAGAPSLADGLFAPHLDAAEARLPGAYFAHEFMPSNWHPLYVDEVREAMAAIGLSPAGSATLVDNFDSFVLRRAERELSAEFADSEAYELVRDVLLHQRFRKDVYTRDGVDLTDKQRCDRLLATRYALLHPAAGIDYQARVEGAGTLTFNNEAAHTVVAALAAGPRRLGDIAPDGIAAQDLLANMLALCCAGIACPVEDRDAPVEAVNRAICAQRDGGEPIEALALRSATAIRANAKLLQVWCGGGPVADAEMTGWLDYLAVHA